jgi:hypothetical protein
MVVVDTGSRDDMIDKARQFPISLHHFAWMLTAPLALSAKLALLCNSEPGYLLPSVDTRSKCPQE